MKSGSIRYPIFALLFATPLAAAEIYVSPAGNDTWSGSVPDVRAGGGDGPFRTFERARDEIRRRRAAGQGRAFTVSIRSGIYPLSKTLELSAEDGGSQAAPVIWQAYKGERTRIVGGRELRRWYRVDDAAIRARIQPEFRDRIRQADLRLHGVTNLGKMRRRGFGQPLQPAPLELFFGGLPMTLARWPNGEWATITATPDGQKGATFTCEGAPMERWRTADDLWVHGLWTYDWADSYEKVSAVDPAGSLLSTAPSHGVYGYTPGKRFYAVNLIEELDEPGEYWVDPVGGKIYFWAPGSLEEQETWVSVLEEPLIRLSSTNHVTLAGLTLEYTRGNAVEIVGGSHNRMAACTLRNIGSLAVSIASDPSHPPSAHTSNGVENCEIYDCGEGAVVIDGGDRKTLTPGGNFVVGNHIYRYQRSCLTYRMAAHVHGVGQRVAHNHIHHAPHTAVLINGNDHVIEYNEIHHVCTETGDAGAFYIGRDLTQRGNVVRYNYFHDLHGVKGQKGFTDVMGVYLDDCTCGTTVLGNIFQNVSRAIVIGGGRDNAVENNIFKDCRLAIHVDARGTSWAKFWFDGKDRTLMDRLKAVNHKQPPYSERYPPLARILEDEPAVPKGNRIVRNICVGGKWLELHDRLSESSLGLSDNLVSGDDPFMDSARRDFRIRPGSPAARIGFQDIPVAEIGPPGLRRDVPSTTPATVDPSAPPE